jgi:hypothetical protein
MNNENLLELMYGITILGAVAGRKLERGEKISETGPGDDKYLIDGEVQELLSEYFLDNTEDISAALKPEDADWEEGEWLTSEGTVVGSDELGEFQYALLLDQVEGTKNDEDRDRYTTIAAIEHEEPTFESIEASMTYRWDDSVFYSDGEQAFSNYNPSEDVNETLNDGKLMEVEPMAEVGYENKLRGQMIGSNAQDYADLIESLIDTYNLPENEWPSLKADGTTTGDILGTITDNSIAVDIREARGRERLPFAQDFAPAAKIAKDAGVKIMNEKGESVNADLLGEGAAVSYIAVPHGKVSEDIVDIVGGVLDE